jgi:hypothetical protein
MHLVGQIYMQFNTLNQSRLSNGFNKVFMLPQAESAHSKTKVLSHNQFGDLALVINKNTEANQIMKQQRPASNDNNWRVIA